MPNYDFHSLSSLDFEELVRDLLQAEWNMRLETFKSGKDQGIDLRYSKFKDQTVVQCKHYVGSGFSKLLTHLRDVELPKIIKLAPSRYVVATSVGLTPQNKDSIVSALSPYLKSAKDVYGPNDLNNLLSLFPEIERANFKLWLTSVEVLQRVLHNAEKCQSDFEVDRISRKLSLYVQSNAYPKALEILDETNILVISGPPGIGKTTLAEMLLYQHLEKGYEPIVIKSEIGEGKKLYRPSRKQIFYFDDFLGQTFLRDRQGFLLQNQDAILVDFLDLVRRSKAARFILTTREHILRNALLSSERFQDNSALERRYILQLSDYSFGQKARILYNHLYFSDLPQPYKLNILEGEFYLDVIRHENYSPRLIEWVSAYSRVKSTAPSDYSSLIARVLENPEKVWQHAFSNQISEAARNILLSLFTLAGESSLIKLERGWNSLHQHKSIKYNYSTAPHEFRQALKELEGSFVCLESNSVGFINPSVKDFLAALLGEIPEHAIDLLASAVRCDQIARIWEVALAAPKGHLRDYLLDREDVMIDGLNRAVKNKLREKVTDGEIKYSIRYDSSLEARAALIASIARVFESDKSRVLLESALQRLWKEWDGVAAEFEEAVQLLKELEGLIDDSSSSNKNQARSLYARTKERLIECYQEAWTSDFEALLNYADTSPHWNEEDNLQIAQSFGEFRKNGYKEEERNYSSAAELSVLLDNVAALGQRMKVDVDYEIKRLQEKINEREQEETRDDSDYEPFTSRAKENSSDEIEVRRMFDSLREN